MGSRSFLSQAVRYSAVILLSILLLPVMPGHGSRVAASMPGAASAAETGLSGVDGQVESWTRTLEPVILTGSQLPLFSGTALGDLFVYAYSGATWTQVPFQLDEVNSTGDYVASEDGVLDSNDELVFMAKDLGVSAALYQWPDDLSSKAYSRYEVKVTNPLNAAEEGRVYVFRSATLVTAFSPYATWDAVNHRVEAISYTATYSYTDVVSDTWHIGLDSLEINGTGVDVLDRSKFYLSGKCWRKGDWDSFAVTEESIEVKEGYKLPTMHGPVRVGGGSLTDPSWSYGYTDENRSKFDASDVPGNCEEIQYLIFRISQDWLNPEESGMAPMTYYNSNIPGGVPVDGVMDTVTGLPVAGWQEWSGALGTEVQVADITASGETVIKNSYWDKVDPNPNDTGDLHHYADAGYKADNPTTLVTMAFTQYYLPAGLGNVGDTYRQYFDNPLQTAVTAQSYYNAAPNKVRIGWLPHPVYSGSEITFTATVGGGLEPFTYNWTFGDDASNAVGNPVTHTFVLAGAIPVTLTVANSYGTAVPVVRYVQVWEPGTELYFIYMPVALYKGH